MTVAGLGTGDRGSVPARTRELLSNADYVIGSAAALAVARPWIRAVELPLRADNREELVNRLARDVRAGLWSMVATLGDPSESAPRLLTELKQAIGTVSLIPAPGFYQLALAQAGLSPLEAVCASVEQVSDGVRPAHDGRATVILGADDAGTWQDVAQALAGSGAGFAPAQLVTGLSGQPSVTTTSLTNVAETEIGNIAAAVDSALILR